MTNIKKKAKGEKKRGALMIEMKINLKSQGSM
jgi:hypothetical protein